MLVSVSLLFSATDTLRRYRNENWDFGIYLTGPDMSILCTRPTQQRRGAASMLLNWGIELADREGLDIFAQASPMILSSGGAGNLGFEEVETWELDAEKLGVDGLKGSRWPLRKALMKRSPSSRDESL